MVIRISTILLLLFVITVNAQNSSSSKILTGKLKDARDGKVYKTVKIGDTWWMAENLNYETATGSWCYDGNSKQCKKTGRLYDWETAKKVAPEGWVRPTKEDFEKMIDLLGGALNSYSKLIKGGKSGFNALYSGGKFDERLYSYLDSSLFLWSSTPDTETLAWCLGLEKDMETSNLNNYNKTLGLSVRCIKK